MLLALSFCTICSAGSGPGGSMTLHDCMEYAISNSTKMRIRKAATGDAQIDRRTAILSAFTPSISGSSSAYYTFGRSIDPETNTYVTNTTFYNSYGISAGITVFDGFNAVNNIKIAKTSLLMGLSGEEQEQAAICLATMEAFYNTVYYSSLSDVYRDVVKTAKQKVDAARKKEELGVKGYAEVVQMESELAQREYDLINTENLYNSALMTLKDVMFWPAGQELSIDTSVADGNPLVANEGMSVDEVVEYAKENRPEAKIAKGAMTNAELSLSTEKMRVIPKFGLYAGWNTTYYKYPGSDIQTEPFADQFSHNAGEYIQLSMSIPIYDRLSRLSTISKKKNALQKASAEYDQKLRDIDSEVRRAVQDRDGALASYTQAQRKADVQSEAYRMNTKKYEQGLISPIEYQTATTDYLKSRSDRLDAMFRYFIKSSVVRYYAGESYINQ